MSGSCLNNPFPACVRQVSLKDDFGIQFQRRRVNAAKVNPHVIKNRIPNKPCSGEINGTTESEGFYLYKL
jgi:hypothetical protein